MPSPSAQQLHDLTLFASLSLDDCERVASWCEEETFAQGDVLAAEGQHDYAFFVVLGGSAEVRHGDRVVRTLATGDHFGEKAILEDGIRTATVAAASPMTAAVMMGFNFRELEQQFPEVAETIHTDAIRWGADDATSA